MLILENKKLHDYIEAKDKLVMEGRGISRQIEMLDIKVKRFEEKEKRITEKAKPAKELTDRGDAIVKELKKLDDELDKLVKKIQEDKLSAIPKDLETDHKAVMADREKLERERNKIALKVQKIKDKIIPLVRLEVKPLLQDPYDDIETAQIKDGKVVISTFNHIDEFKKRFKK
jgi:DNA repair ATPase RecN